jgi:hypothetical protein
LDFRASFLWTPELPSFGLPGFFPLDSHNLATPCLGREPKARVATMVADGETRGGEEPWLYLGVFQGTH